MKPAPRNPRCPPQSVPRCGSTISAPSTHRTSPARWRQRCTSTAVSWSRRSQFETSESSDGSVLVEIAGGPESRRDGGGHRCVTRRVGAPVGRASGRAGWSRLQFQRRQLSAAVRADVLPHPAARVHLAGSARRATATDRRDDGVPPTRPGPFPASERSRTPRSRCSTASTWTTGTMSVLNRLGTKVRSCSRSRYFRTTTL